MPSETMKSNFEGINLPYSLDAEQAVLGSILIDPQSLIKIASTIKSDYFYIPQHKAIYEAILSLDSSGVNIDPLMILERLKKDGVFDEAGGKEYLYQIYQTVPSAANVEAYANIVKEKYYVRALINASQDIMDSASQQEDSADVLIDSAEQKIYDIRQGKTSNMPSQIGDVIVNDVYVRLYNLNSDNKEDYLGIPTGYGEIDKAISGLNKSDLIIIGARPAMGKTSFALNIARNVAVKANKTVLFFSLEMSKEQLAQRVLATEARVMGNKMRTGDMTQDEWYRISSAAQIFNKCPIYIDDTSNITVPEMKARIRRMKNVDCVFIDYLQLMKGTGRSENRVQEVSEITRSLKLMAKDLQIPVITLAQLARSTEARGKSHRPQMADLRESGSIEQDADIVMLLYRPDYYSEDEIQDDQSEDYAPEIEKLDVIVSKNRHGPTETVTLGWNPDYTLVSNLEKIHNEN